MTYPTRFAKSLSDEPPLIAPRHVLQEELPGTGQNPWRVLYPLVMTNITIENGHRNSGFTQLENGGFEK